MKEIETILKQKDYFIKSFVFKIIKSQNLTLNETLLLIFFLNQEKPVLDLNLIKKITLLNDLEIMEAFSSLTNKSLIKTEIQKDDNKIEEILNLDNLYKLASLNFKEEEKQNTTTDIFSIFEQEFARTLSPIEYELINAWINSGVNEELIIGA